MQTLSCADIFVQCMVKILRILTCSTINKHLMLFINLTAVKLSVSVSLKPIIIYFFFSAPRFV